MYGILTSSYEMLPNLENTFVKNNRLCKNFVKYFYISCSSKKGSYTILINDKDNLNGLLCFLPFTMSLTRITE